MRLQQHRPAGPRQQPGLQTYSKAAGQHSSLGRPCPRFNRVLDGACRRSRIGSRGMLWPDQVDIGTAAARCGALPHDRPRRVHERRMRRDQPVTPWLWSNQQTRRPTPLPAEYSRRSPAWRACNDLSGWRACDAAATCPRAAKRRIGARERGSLAARAPAAGALRTEGPSTLATGVGGSATSARGTCTTTLQVVLGNASVPRKNTVVGRVRDCTLGDVVARYKQRAVSWCCVQWDGMRFRAFRRRMRPATVTYIAAPGHARTSPPSGRVAADGTVARLVARIRDVDPIITGSNNGCSSTCCAPAWPSKRKAG